MFFSLKGGLIRDFSVFFVTWMVFNDFTTQSVAVDVCVNFSRSDAFMPQHALNGSEVGTPFQQMRGEGMSECVRADGFLQANGFC